MVRTSMQPDSGKWRKLYKHNYGMTSPPEAVGKDNKPLVKEDPDSYDEEMVPVPLELAQHGFCCCFVL